MTSKTLPAIVEAARRATVLEAALAYTDLGISVLPVSGKVPAIRSWAERQRKRAPVAMIQYWHREGLLSGVGIVAGTVSNNLVVVDLDSPEAVATYLNRWPELADTYMVTSGSGKGAHLYYYAKVMPRTTRVVNASGGGNIELRADGTYVVAPPSLHPSGKPYSVARELPIMHVDNLNDVVRWIKSLTQQKHGGKTPAPNVGQGRINNSTAYGRAALAGEAAAVRMAPPGARNNQLYRSALKMGSLIADGRIDRGSVESALFAAAAALAVDDGEASVLRTIASGINKGLESSRDRHKLA